MALCYRGAVGLPVSCAFRGSASHNPSGQDTHNSVLLYLLYIFVLLLNKYGIPC